MDWILAISITLNVVLVILLLFRNEESTAHKQALKGIAELGTDTSAGVYVDRGEVVRMALEALAGHEKSVMQRFNDWRARRKAAKQAQKESAPEASGASVNTWTPPAPPPTNAPAEASEIPVDSTNNENPAGDTSGTPLPENAGGTGVLSQPWTCTRCGRVVAGDTYHDCTTPNPDPTAQSGAPITPATDGATAEPTSTGESAENAG